MSLIGGKNNVWLGTALIVRMTTTSSSELAWTTALDIERAQWYSPVAPFCAQEQDAKEGEARVSTHWRLTQVCKLNSDRSALCELRNVSGGTRRADVFFKMIPLFDPLRYLLGNYHKQHGEEALFVLPHPTRSTLAKLETVHNSAYVDGLFTALTSQLLHRHRFEHGIDCFGTCLGIKRNLTINVAEDLDYLLMSESFHAMHNVLYTADIEDRYLSHPVIRKVPLQWSPSAMAAMDADCVDEVLEEVEEKEEQGTREDDLLLLDQGEMMASRPEKNEEQEQEEEEDHADDNSDISSRVSDTDTEYDDETGWEDISDDGLDETEQEEEEEGEIEEEEVPLTILQCPVHVIAMEQCECTVDELVLRGELDDPEAFLSMLMQVIFTLIVYQDVYAFTHNDLHARNIMCQPTRHKYLWYKYLGQTYRVPTMGRVYKIIDFGRSIYTVGGVRICSDAFDRHGDAYSQYNTEPFFDPEKPRLDPNPSFDLCRLAISLFDLVIPDPHVDWRELTNPAQSIIFKLCLDDEGRNMVCKRDGSERYLDFKLYKMISRCVHIHTPHAQLYSKELSQFRMHKRPSPKDRRLDLDALIDAAKRTSSLECVALATCK